MKEATMNIYQRINAVRKAIGYVQKDKAVSTGGGSYKAVTHDAVTGMVRAALIDNGVIVVPSVISSVFHPKEPDAKQRLYEATYQIEFVNMDDPADRIVTNQNAHALDNGDKAPGKAMSYATKYAILKLFNIETGEEEESRYQQEEFDYLPLCESILACRNESELKKVYQEAYRKAEDARNKEAQAMIIKAKDKAKAAIALEVAGQA